MIDQTHNSVIIAERLKQLRKDRGYSHERLSKALSERYGINISRDSLMSYEVSSEHHTKAKKNLGMRVEYLLCLAHFYGVSTDYILGRTQTMSPDINAQAIIEYTGLSEKNIGILHNMVLHSTEDGIIEHGNRHGLNGCKPFIDCLNDLLEAVYSVRHTIMKHYIRLRRSTNKNGSIDLWYFKGENGGFISGFEPMPYRDSRTQYRFDNEQVEYHCSKISKAVEEFLLDRYLVTPESAEEFLQEIEHEEYESAVIEAQEKAFAKALWESVKASKENE